MKLDYSLREKMNLSLRELRNLKTHLEKQQKLDSYLKTNNELQMDED